MNLSSQNKKVGKPPILHLFVFMNPNPCQSFNMVSFVSVLVPVLCPAWRLVPIHSVLADLNEKCLNVFLNSFHTLWTMEFLVLSSMASILKLPHSHDLIFGVTFRDSPTPTFVFGCQPLCIFSYSSNYG